MTRRTVVCSGSSLAAEREMLARLEDAVHQTGVSAPTGAHGTSSENDFLDVHEPHPVGGQELQPGQPPFAQASHQQPEPRP